jgi:hypothetical protein
MKLVKLQIYNVPEDWAEFLVKEAQKKGISVSDYVKAFILEPYIKKAKAEVAVA